MSFVKTYGLFWVLAKTTYVDHWLVRSFNDIPYKCHYLYINYISLRYLPSCNIHLPDSQARCSRGLRPSLAESVLSFNYWGREDDLDIEYSLIFQQNANLMLAHCLRRWLNINPTLPHVRFRVW